MPQKQKHSRDTSKGFEHTIFVILPLDQPSLEGKSNPKCSAVCKDFILKTFLFSLKILKKKNLNKVLQTAYQPKWCIANFSHKKAK